MFLTSEKHILHQSSESCCYLLLAALGMLLSILGFSQQVGEGKRFEGAGAGGSGVPERVCVS